MVIGISPILQPSSIISSTFSVGNAGNLNINTKRLAIKKGGIVDTSTTFIGDAGSITINASESIEISSAAIDSRNPSLINSSANLLNSFVVTRRGGILHNPSHFLNLNSTWLDIRDLSAFRKRDNNTVENTQISNKPAIVEATGFIRNADGEIELVAVDNTPFVNKQVAECSGANT